MTTYIRKDKDGEFAGYGFRNSRGEDIKPTSGETKVRHGKPKVWRRPPNR
jgi:hypothetical protein